MDKMNRRILVVDDNTSIHQDYFKTLCRSNSSSSPINQLEAQIFGTPVETKSDVNISYDVTFCTQGEEAIEAVDSAALEGRPYALVFMDVRMPPGMNGIEATRKIWEKHKDLQVVICSAYSDYSWAEMIEKLGCSSNLLFLKKPFEQIEVQQMALALTTKWNLNKSVQEHTENLKELVEERTKELGLERARSIQNGKLTALGEMAGGIAHEINNPLTIIDLHSNILKDLVNDDPIDKPQLQAVTNTITETVGRIVKIIKGLRAFSRNGDNDPFEAVTFEQIMEETLGICGERFKNHGVAVHLENLNPNLQFECRRVQIMQVFINLLNNAFDAIEGLAEKWVRVTIEEMQDKVVFSFIDSGTGIKKEITDKIYQPFFTTKEIGKGTGLGLSISKGLIESHKGKLWLDSSNKNTCFKISLPKKQAPPSNKSFSVKAA